MSYWTSVYHQTTEHRTCCCCCWILFITQYLSCLDKPLTVLSTTKMITCQSYTNIR